MSSLVDAYVPAAVWLIVKASLLIGAVATVQALMARRTSAATRHLAWTLAVIGLLLLPALSVVMPRWDVGIRIAGAIAPEPPPIAAATSSAADESIPGSTGSTGSTTASRVEPIHASPLAATTMSTSTSRTTAATTTSARTPAPDVAPVSRAAGGVRIPWVALVSILYAAGALLLLARLAAQRLMVRRLARQASEVHDAEWTGLLIECAHVMGVRQPVRLLRSREQAMPMAFGTRHPTILIPAVADLWSDDRRRAVLLHELAHVARHDCLTQTLAALACALYFPHPGVWWIARRLRVERELACDDRVLSAGAQARDYAGHLLELAYALGGHRAPALAVTMARPRQLEGRMLAVLDAARNRATPGPRSRLAGLAITSALLLPLAAVDSTTASARTAVVGAAMADGRDDGANDSGRGRASATSGTARTASASVTASSSATAAPAESMASAGMATSGAPVASATATAASARTASATSGTEESDQRDEDGPQLPGTWEMRLSSKPGYVYLRLTEGYRSSSSRDVPIDTLEGLTSEQLSGTGGPVRFSIRREAGTLAFEGTVRGGVGGGMFAFTPNAQYGEQLKKRGVQAPMPSEQYELAKADIGIAYLDELKTQGYPTPTLEELVRAGQHGVHAQFLKEMGATGYRLGTIETLIRFRDHGVTPTYIREMASAGYSKIPAEELLRARDHGVNPDYVKEMRDLGYGTLSLDELVKARDHGVKADFVRALAASGYQKLPLETVIKVRDHGVNPDYVKALRDHGFGSLSVDQVVKARDHGLSADYLREMGALGFQKLPFDDLIRVRDHGVTPDYVRQMRDLGYGSADVDDIVKARDHGVGVDFVRELTSLGYKSLPLDTVIRMRDHGVSTSFVRELKALGYDRIEVDDLIGLRNHGVSADKIRRANERAGTRLPLDMIRSLAR